ncbi:hypothetical protein AMJ39_03110 [candidate division TA06 bacterium DG_24]|uniref:Radical SAM core domain-containing protein n=1 Tax=candidate division TA06 bacterium DG_24 TaxID=1703770 RepID=A0A0S7WUF7_UNCT6|nr:MAG: hypothetical protein AMJ39_03110 [candidate division TA06 bacterium DG_24]
MDALKKIDILGRAAQHDICAACGPSQSRIADPVGRWIYPSVLPQSGKKVFLLKTLLSNACEESCRYCANRRSRDFRRVTFTPEELARLFINLRDRGMVQGLFLSSAVSGSVAGTMERLIRTAEILRLKMGFRGYLHLKIIPGASFDHVARAMELASRVSVNMEAPGEEHLADLCPGKELSTGIVERMRWIRELHGAKRLSPAGQTTQFVVGAAGESDRDLVQRAAGLYGEFDLARVYYSAFQPVSDTPLENLPPTPPMREHRLYQTDYLLRRYGFSADEIIFSPDGNLALTKDPKSVWAENHPERFPVEVNRASREELLRVPGIGPVSATRIVRLRQRERLRREEQLRGTGAIVKRTLPYLLFDGRRPRTAMSQLSLWAPPVRTEGMKESAQASSP